MRMFGAPGGALVCGGHHGVDSLKVARTSPWNDGFGWLGTCNSLRFDVRRLDDRPPLLDFGLVKGGERLGRLPLARKDLLAKIGEARTDRRIGPTLHDRSIEPADDCHRRACTH